LSRKGPGEQSLRDWLGDSRRLLLVVVVAPLALFLPVLLAGKAVFWGTPLLQFIPWWDFAWSHVREGYLPLWNPYSGMGAPLLANYQSALFYPPHWIYFLLHLLGGRSLMAWGMALLMTAHLAFAGMGMAMLVRRLGLGRLSQVVAGLGFGMCGYLVARAGFLSINAAAAWIPWILLCLTPKKPGARIPIPQRLTLVVVLGMQLLAGHAQTTWYTWLLAGMWVLFMGWIGIYTDKMNPSSGAGERPSYQGRTRQLAYSAGLLIFGILMALALAAVQLLPTAEYLSFSQRSDAVDYDASMTYSLWPWRMLGLFAPDLFGNPAQADYWGYGNFWEDAVYIGLLPAILALGALLAAFRRNAASNPGPVSDTELRGMVLGLEFRRFLVFICATSLVLALGSNTPIFPWLYRNIPGFDSFQAPSRFLIWLEVALCLAAALGAETWRRPERGGLYWTRLATAGAFAVALGAGLTWYLLGEVQPTFIRATALAGLWGMGAGLLSLAAPRSGGERDRPIGVHSITWQWLVAGWIAADLLVAGMGLNPGIDLDAYRSSPAAQELSQELDGHRLYLSPNHEQQLKYESFLRFDSFEAAKRWDFLRSTILPNTNIFEQISSVNNFDPLLPGSYAVWMETVDRLPPADQVELFRLMDVGLLQQPGLLQPEQIQIIPMTDGKRIRFASCALSVRDTLEALEKTTSGEVDFDSTVVLEGVSDSPATCVAADTSIPLKIIEENPSEIVINIDVPGAGYLVISDLWYPGWKAWVGESEAPILHANFLFRAVAVGSGKQQVTLRYQPLSFYLGVVTSAAALIILLVVLRKTANSGDTSG